MTSTYFFIAVFWTLLYKKFEKAKTAGADNVEQLFNEAVSAIDKAQSKGLIKANKAARDKSRMAARLAK